MSDLAVIRAGGKQYVVRPGTRLRLANFSSKKESENFVDVLSGATVKAKILETKRGDKIQIRKFRGKSRYLRRKGYRPLQTTLLIEKIGGKR